MAKSKILICEDEPIFKKLIRDVLMQKNYDIHLATDGQDALDKTKEINPDLIIMDIRMPKMDGVEVLKELRKFNLTVKVIFLTAFQSPALIQEIAKYDVSDYIVKPAAIDDILSSIKKALVD